MRLSECRGIVNMSLCSDFSMKKKKKKVLLLDTNSVNLASIEQFTHFLCFEILGNQYKYHSTYICTP